MKTIHFLLLTLCFANTLNAANVTLKSQWQQCQNIENKLERLDCYDQISIEHDDDNTINTADITTTEDSDSNRPDEFPILIADLNEPNLMISFGQLDFLGNTFKTALVGVGKRHLIKTFELPNEQSFAFNVIGQIRSQFDIDEINTRNNRGGTLINTDFSIGGEIVKSMKDWNWRLSYTHRSTHLGDEFIIDNQQYLEDRINLSYETIRWDAAKSIKNWDIYAGLGFISRSEPSSLDKFMWQSGVQYQGQWHHWNPFIAIDLTSWGAYEWNINANIRAGFEITQLTHTPFQLSLEYFDGHSPYGQFFTEDLSYTGITLIKGW